MHYQVNATRFFNSWQWIGNMSRMGLFYAYNNQLSGSIPSLFGKYFHIHILQLLFSHRMGWIADGDHSLAILQLQQNLLSGTIPDSFGKDSG